MGVEGCALQLLRACGIGQRHLLTLLQPTNGLPPQTEAQFSQLQQALRRHGHIAENVQGNIASVLQGPFRQARANAYHAIEDQRSHRDVVERSQDNPVSQPFSEMPTVQSRTSRTRRLLWKWYQ